MKPCTCGHSIEEHDHCDDPDFPGSTACQVEECDCIAYEAEEEIDLEDREDD